MFMAVGAREMTCSYRAMPAQDHGGGQVNGQTLEQTQNQKMPVFI